MRIIILKAEDKEFEGDDKKIVKGLNLTYLTQDGRTKNAFLTPEKAEQVGYKPSMVTNIFDELVSLEATFEPGYQDKMKLVKLTPGD